MFKKKVKVCILRSNPVSPDSRVEKEAKTLINNDYDVHIVGWDREDNYKELRSDITIDDVNIPITRIGNKASYGDGFKNILPFMKFQKNLFIWLVKNRKSIDVVHACDFDTAFTSSVYAKIFKKKIIFDIFDFLFSDPNNLFQKIVKFAQIKLINISDGTIICSEDRINQIKDSNPKKLAIIHNSPEFVKFNSSKYKSNKVKKLVYVGILQKNRLLKEITEVVKRRKDIELTVAGFGKYEDFFKKISNEYNNINFLGKISYSHAINLESEADIMLAIYDPIIDNHKYAAPNKFYEGLMLGKPLIMARGTGMSNYIEQENIGVLIEYSEKGFEEGLDRLLNIENDWFQMSIRMRRLYHDQFSWSAMQNRLLYFYEEIVTGM